MKDNFLSQAEVDALLRKKDSIEDEFILGDKEKDIIGEVGNISMSTAATTLSSIINCRVLITTPKVELIPFQQIIDECVIPKVVSKIEFKEGLKGSNILMMDVSDACIIADLMMGGKGIDVNDKLTDLEISAVAEAMNQMIGSASTSMATMLGKNIDILPPEISLWDTQANINYDKMLKGKDVCKISFNLSVEGLIESEIMQLYTIETLKDIISIMDFNDDKNTNENNVNDREVKENTIENILIEENKIEEEKEEKSISNKEQEQVVIQKPVFAPLKESGEKNSQQRNLDLIMDVPLEFSVVLGKTKKSIRNVLSLTSGSVVELDKLADEPLEIYVNGKLIAHGEVVVINEKFGIRITNILSREQRVQRLK